MNKELRFHVCECGAQTPISQTHTCQVQGQRLAAELVDAALAGEHSFYSMLYFPVEVKKLESATDGIGLLWLYRIAFRIRSRMDGLEKYKDRADLARRVCRLLDPVEDYENKNLGERE